METPHQDLDAAWAAMSYEVLPGRFVLLGFLGAPREAELRILGAGPGQLVCEGGETTWLLASAAACQVLAAHHGARSEEDLVWVRFTAPMSWDLVGFLARVAGSMAAAGVPLGAVCGFSRDSIFFHQKFLSKVLRVLQDLFPGHDA